MVPEQHSDRLQAGELCFARLIGLLLEHDFGLASDLPCWRQSYSSLDPERQSLLLVLPGFELRGPRAMVAPVFCLLYGIACISHARHSSFTTLDLV
jgi:hypothetical protein